MRGKRYRELYELLETKTEEFNRPAFIALDPISIPHAYSRQQDIEISGLLAAILAWGQRKTIISKCREFFQLMDNAPYDFILHHREHELKPYLDFKHRTFNATDALYLIAFLRHYYQQHTSLEDAFAGGMQSGGEDVRNALIHFHHTFFSLPDAPQRTRKHIATPERNSACKRLNMYLRWMVRQDERGVDFGLWKKISPSQLVCPCDLHVDRVARRLGLISRKQTDWLAAQELTQNLRSFDPHDPVKYDFALFGLGLEERGQ
ncbi:MAG: TIGR02757 family protein [bacterium]